MNLKINSNKILLLLISLVYISISITQVIIKNDTPEPWTIGFQDGVSPGYTGIIELHDNIFFYLVVIAILVFWMLGSILYFFNYDRTKISHKYLVHGTLIEIIWTIFPAIVLLAIAIPSFRLLYILDEVTLPTITVKVTGLLNDGQKSYIKILLIFYKNKNLYLSPLFCEALLTCGACYLPIFSRFSTGQYNNKSIRLFNTHCRAIKRIGPHNKDIISIIYGLLLGDGYANNRSGEGVRLAIKQSEIHKDYLFYLYNFFFIRGYCSNLIPRKYLRKIKGKNKTYYGYEFNTFTFRSFVWIYDSFYKKGKKIVPFNLERYMNELTLAILIMDDGCWTGNGVRISTNSFSIIEIERLKNILNKNFGLICTIQRLSTKDSTKAESKEQKYSLYIIKSSIEKLRILTLPFFHKSMLYKLGITSN